MYILKCVYNSFQLNVEGIRRCILLTQYNITIDVACRFVARVEIFWESVIKINSKQKLQRKEERLV